MLVVSATIHLRHHQICQKVLRGQNIKMSLLMCNICRQTVWKWTLTETLGLSCKWVSWTLVRQLDSPDHFLLYRAGQDALSTLFIVVFVYKTDKKKTQITQAFYTHNERKSLFLCLLCCYWSATCFPPLFPHLWSLPRLILMHPEPVSD